MELVSIQLAGLVLSLLAGELLHQGGLSKYIPESAATLVVGMLLGALVLGLSPAALVDASQFSTLFFTLALLPIVIFESGYSLYRAPFFSHLGAIMLYAVVGTLVSAGVTTAVIASVAGDPASAAALGIPLLSFWESATIGALLSATDPVATLTVFSALRVEPVLNALVYGESVMNDAMGIVLFKVAASFVSAPPTAASLVAAAESVALVLLGAVAWGALVGLLCTRLLNDVNMRGLMGEGSLLTRVVQGVLRGGRSTRRAPELTEPGSPAAGHAPPPSASDAASASHHKEECLFLSNVLLGCGETAYLLLAGYCAFTSAEALGLSGIVAVLCCGVTLAVYARPIMSWPGRKVSTALLRFLAGLADAAIFLQIGLGLVVLGRPSGGELALAAIAFFGCLLGRAANVFPLSTAINLASGRAVVSGRSQVQMWWAGLRGGIAFASAEAFPTANAPFVARSVGVLCVATIAVMGPTTVPLLDRLRIAYGPQASAAAGAGAAPCAARQPLHPMLVRADALLRLLVYSRTTQALLAAHGGSVDAEPIVVLSPGRRSREGPQPDPEAGALALLSARGGSVDAEPIGGALSPGWRSAAGAAAASGSAAAAAAPPQPDFAAAAGQ